MTRAALATLTLCASQERTLAARSRWVQAFAIVFAALAMGVASSGYILTGGFGVQTFGRTAASLLQLVALLVPLTSLVMGVLALASERGLAELLYSQPIERGAVLLGRLLGLWQALVCAEALGFGLAGAIIFSQADTDGIAGFAALFGATIVLTAVFLSIAGMIASTAIGQQRTRALAAAIVVWFVAVILFDLVALAIASVLRSGAASRVLIVSVLINPLDAIRTGTLLAIEGTAAFGAASLAFLRFTKGATGAAVFVVASTTAWILIPLWIAARRLRQSDV
jgi:Cu-processing system permease protein